MSKMHTNPGLRGTSVPVHLRHQSWCPPHSNLERRYHRQVRTSTGSRRSVWRHVRRLRQTWDTPDTWGSFAGWSWGREQRLKMIRKPRYSSNIIYLQLIGESIRYRSEKTDSMACIDLRTQVLSLVVRIHERRGWSMFVWKITTRLNDTCADFVKNIARDYLITKNSKLS